MASYGADTPKRHVCYSNSVEIKKLDKGRLQGWKRRSGKKVKTVEHYRDAAGKRRWKGTRALRSTEFLGQYSILLGAMKFYTCLADPLSVGSHGLFQHVFETNGSYLGCVSESLRKRLLERLLAIPILWILMVSALVDIESKPCIYNYR